MKGAATRFQITARKPKGNLPMVAGHRQCAWRLLRTITSAVVLLWMSGLITAAEIPLLPESSLRAPPTVVRIACFNTEALAVPKESSRFARERFDPGRQRHLERVAAVIEVVDPDILVLSEIASAKPVEMLAAMLREKGLGDFQAYHVDGRDRFTGFDVAMLSRLTPDQIDGASVRLFAPEKTP